MDQKLLMDFCLELFDLCFGVKVIFIIVELK